ncbi:MAG: hypothetical protein ACLF0G_09585 [Candidatus Brocadiia bacterium]
MPPRTGKLLALVLAALAAAGFAAEGVSIRQTDPAELELGDEPTPLYRVQGRTYRAEVYPDGRLRILAGETELVRSLVLEVGGKVKALGDIRAGEGERIVLREGAPSGAAQAPGDEAEKPERPGVSLRFLPRGLELAPLGLGKKDAKGLPRAQLAGVFGDQAVGVRNLRDGRRDALPADHVCSRHRFSFYGWLGEYWPHVQATYADGTRLELRGISGVAHYAVGRRDPHTSEALEGRRGYWALRGANDESTVELTVRPGGEPTAPAPYSTVHPRAPRGLFYEGERAVHRIEFAEAYRVPGQWRAEWTLEDHRQRPVGRGAREVGTIPEQATVDLTPGEMGHFRVRLVLRRTDARAAQRLHELEFSRIRPEAPELRALDGQRGVDGEMLWANILGMRGLRLNPSFASIWGRHHRPDGSIDWAAYKEAFAQYLRPARQGTIEGLFSFTGLNGSRQFDAWARKRTPDEGDRERAVAEVKRRYLAGLARHAGEMGVEAWEPVNEPNLRMKPQDYIEKVLKVQYPALKAGNPQANVLGGSICGLGNYGWLRRLYELGGHEWFDGASFHPYTGLGFQEAYRAELEQWWQVLRDFGDADQGLWMTESAWHRGWGYQDYVYDRFGAFRQSQARNAVHMHLNAEGMGVPRRRIYVFYLVEHGYNDFYLVRRRWLTPAAVAIQVMNECLRDARLAGEIPLPGKGHHFQVYRDATRTVAVPFTNGEPAELTLVTDADQVVATDLMGNRQTLEPQAGRLRVTASGDPLYLVVGPKHTLRPSYEGLRVQPNLAVPTLGATARASSVAEPRKGKPPLPPSAAISGDWTCYASAGALTGARRGWDEAEEGKDQWPDWLEVRLPRPVPVARVRVVHDYGAWERVLRDYDVQVFAGGEWHTVGGMRDNRYAFVGDHRFEPVRSARVRVLVHKVNSCLFESIHWIPKLSTLRAVEVYPAPGRRAEAFFVQEVPKRRILAPGGSMPLRFRIQNAGQGPVEAEMRLVVPEGIAASPGARRVSVPAGEGAECSFEVRLAEDAEVGLYTVLAGLYRGDELVCPDYAPRVLCCKKTQEE